MQDNLVFTGVPEKTYKIYNSLLNTRENPFLHVLGPLSKENKDPEGTHFGKILESQTDFPWGNNISRKEKLKSYSLSWLIKC